MKFNQIFLITTTLLTTASCGKQKNKEATGFSTSTLMSATRDLTPSERTVATRVCYAYQSKNNSFKTQSYFGGSFTFNLSSKSCAEVKESYSVVGVLGTSLTDRNALVFSSNTTKPFESKVQTAQSGFLSQLCSKIQNNLPISNTAVVEGVSVQVAFVATDMDTYTLRYFTPQNNVMKIQSAETFKVRTQFNLEAGQILGMDEQYSRQTVCAADGSKYSEFIQNYVNFVIQ